MVSKITSSLCNVKIGVRITLESLLILINDRPDTSILKQHCVLMVQMLRMP